jgi:hypothetical protein
LVVTPIYWQPTGHPIASGYQKVINRYLQDVAADSGKHTNVFSTLTEYYGSNGPNRYHVRFHTALIDRNQLPASGCTVASNDHENIYSDNSGYNSCLDDNQIIAETQKLVRSHELPKGLAHIYVMFLPKHVESCFFPGSTTTSANFCTINHQPSAAYCAYHSFAPGSSGSGTVYANMPFPIYKSQTGFGCTAYPNASPNGNLDADVEISPTSHEIMEAATDPDTTTGWFDDKGYENGDECAYVYGPTHGTSAHLYNQVINGHHYLTQEEFSNKNFFATGNGCVQRKRWRSD